MTVSEQCSMIQSLHGVYHSARMFGDHDLGDKTRVALILFFDSQLTGKAIVKDSSGTGSGPSKSLGTTR